MTIPFDEAAASVDWQVHGGAWALADDEVHVWCVAVDNTTSDLGLSWPSLSLAERQRADSYRRPEDRRRFATTREATRRLLAAYCGTPADQVHFDQTPAGKPVLAGAEVASGLHFNVSHSGDLALLAFSRRHVGVDLEMMRPGVACLPIARRYFSTLEVADLESLREADCHAAFYRCWTRKEAYVKGTGFGISFGLASFSVSCLPDAPALLVRPRLVDETPWQLFDLPLPEGYVGSLAVEGANSVRLERFRWSLNDP